MNRPLDVTISRTPPALREVRAKTTADESDSGVFKLFESAVLVIATPGQDLSRTMANLERAGFSIVCLDACARVEQLAVLPRFALLETALPGALDLVQRMSHVERAERAEPVMQTLALLGSDELEGAALAAGATLTLRRPLNHDDVLLCMERFRSQDELRRTPPHVFEQPHGGVPATILESVLATIGHEIKNPLSAALASVECLRELEIARRLDEEERAAAIDDVAIALRRIRDVMGAVTSLVRGTPPALERVQLWECAERAACSLSVPGARIEMAGDHEVWGYANCALLEQVIANLLQNAVDATRDTENPRILVRVYRAALEARISIRDNGPGVPASIRERIFEPFFTTKGERGTGLGLVLVHHAASRMGGAVTLGPSQTGAVFRVRLRRA